MSTDSDTHSKSSNLQRGLTNYPTTGICIFSIGALSKRSGGVTCEDVKPEYTPLMIQSSKNLGNILIHRNTVKMR